MGWKTPAWLPEASSAGAPCRSSSVTCQPRDAHRSDTAAPATPAPITIAAWGGCTCFSARLPHRGVLRRREAVGEKRVRRELQSRQSLGDVAEEERQDDAAAFEFEAMHSRNEHRPAGNQLGFEIRKFFQKNGKVFRLKRM